MRAHLVWAFLLTWTEATWRLFCKYHLSNLYVSGSHYASPLPCHLRHHDGDAVVLVPPPVLSLTVLVTIGDWVTLAALVELPTSNQSASGANGWVTHFFRHPKVFWNRTICMASKLDIEQFQVFSPLGWSPVSGTTRGASAFWTTRGGRHHPQEGRHLSKYCSLV